MPVKALIVDDSRTARVVLQDMLKRRGLEVDTVDSAEAGLDYLAHQRTDLVFLDHMMPGMDGFEAVKHIRADPSLAGVPIVMYTTQGDDMYVGQARALGAADLLHKPPTNDDLDSVLARLRTGGDVAVADTGFSVESHEEPEANDPLPPASPPVADTGVTTATGGAGSERFAFWSGRGWWLAALATLVVLVWLVYPDRTAISRSAAESLVGDLEWLGNREAIYGFDDIPFSDSRLAVVERVADALRSTGMRGSIHLRAHVGQFCRVANGSAALPPPAAPVEACDVIGYSAGEAARLAERASPRFRAWLDRWNGADSGVRVTIDPVGVADPLFAYPSEREVRTAGDWNRIAALNNRVEMVIRPD